MSRGEGLPVEQQIEAMRKFKRVVLEEALALAGATGFEFNFDGTADWVDWHNMTITEREENPEAMSAKGFFRIGVTVTGYINV